VHLTLGSRRVFQAFSAPQLFFIGRHPATAPAQVTQTVWHHPISWLTSLSPTGTTCRAKHSEPMQVLLTTRPPLPTLWLHSYCRLLAELYFLQTILTTQSSGPGACRSR
jgi:hypothetical protein